MYRWSQKSIERMFGVSELLVQCATMALERSKHDMTIPKFGGFRTVSDQKKLFDGNATNADGINKKSKHQFGLALDIIPIDGYVSPRKFNHFAQHMFDCWSEMMIEIGGYKYNLHWGGLWENLIDMPHWELVEIQIEKGEEK